MMGILKGWVQMPHPPSCSTSTLTSGFKTCLTHFRTSALPCTTLISLLLRKLLSYKNPLETFLKVRHEKLGKLASLWTGSKSTEWRLNEAGRTLEASLTQFKFMLLLFGLLASIFEYIASLSAEAAFFSPLVPSQKLLLVIQKSARFLTRALLLIVRVQTVPPNPSHLVSYGTFTCIGQTVCDA